MTLVRPDPAARLCDEAGWSFPAPADRWFGPADGAECRALDGARGPVLDIGCGPGRHVVALAERGIPALGIDITRGALDHARARGVPVLERCIFGHLPGAGRWRTALLLDGNIGIGGNPLALLRRVVTVLAPDGRALVEVGARGTARPRTRVRFEVDGGSGPWFDWAAVDRDGLETLAAASGLVVHECWCDDGRWFTWLGR